MPRNLEIKVKLQSLIEVKNILSKNRIKLKEVLNQQDIYYKTGKGLLKLRIENGNHTLIFYDRSENTEKRWSDFYLLEFGKENPKDFLSKFLKPMVIVEKRRELYLYKNTRIHLDGVKKLGQFLELETKVLNGSEDAEVRFNYLVDLLRLRRKREIRASYKDLLIKKTL